MKKLYTFFFAAVCFAATIQAQVIFQSNFSAWTGTVPDGWVGSKTSLAPDSISQVSTGSLYGTSSVRLISTTANHKRFTTQPFPVVQGDTFEIQFWVKGKADIRTGIFDNKLSTGNSGFHYNSYVSLNSTSWAMYSQTITADTTWAAAEFIFSVRNSDPASDHVQIDSVTIKYAVAQPPSVVSIYAIQGAGASSPYANQTVITKGVVAAYATYKHPTDPNKDYRSYFLQDGDSAWSGIWVSDTINYLNVASGDSVSITAQVQEFFNYTRLKNITSFQKTTGGPQPSAVIVSALEANDEKYEGVLVEVTNAVVTDVTNIAFGNFSVNDGTDTLEVDDIMYGPSTDPVLNDVLWLRGCMFYSFNTRYLLPRKPSDFTWLNSMEEEPATGQRFSVFPNPNNGKFLVSSLHSNDRVTASFEIYNVLGDVVLKSQALLPEWQISQNLPGGIYFLKIYDGNTSETHRIAVVK